MKIVTASVNDAGTLSRLNRHVHQLHLESAPDFFHEPSHEEATDAFRDLLGKEDVIAFLAIEGGDAVGYVLTFVRDREANAFCPARHFLLIDQLSVEPAWQDSGIGRALMDAALRLADEMKIERVEVETWAFNHRAQAFFQAAGFRPKTLRYEMKR